MYGLSNGMNTNELKWVWRSLLLFQVTKCIIQSLCNSRASCYWSCATIRWKCDWLRAGCCTCRL